VRTRPEIVLVPLRLHEESTEPQVVADSELRGAKDEQCGSESHENNPEAVQMAPHLYLVVGGSAGLGSTVVQQRRRIEATDRTKSYEYPARHYPEQGLFRVLDFTGTGLTYAGRKTSNHSKASTSVGRAR
jgi:hypothetical protein